MAKGGALRWQTLFAAVCFVLHLASACEVKKYTQKLVPACDANDLRIKWPNYEDQTTYYRCAAVKASQLMQCPNGEVFVYVLQECMSCDRYLPAVECSRLPTQNPPVCVNIGSNGNGGNGNGGNGNGGNGNGGNGNGGNGNGGNGNGGNENGGNGDYPTPYYPESVTTPKPDPTTEAAVTTDVTDDGPPQEPGVDPNATTAEPTEETPAFPGPPSPQPTGVPLPPSPEPTPESIPGEPPHEW